MSRGSRFVIGQDVIPLVSMLLRLYLTGNLLTAILQN